MIEFGETLRRTREAKGLTTSQVAQTTRLLVQQIEALEREDFSRIAAPIYGRGFVKLYCEALGIDPKPLVAEFMEIYTGNRQPAIKMRAPVVSAPVPPAPPPELASAPAPAPIEPASPPEPEESEPPAPVEPAPIEPVPPPPPPAPEPLLPEQPVTPQAPEEEPPTFTLESETIHSPAATHSQFEFEQEPPAPAGDEFFPPPRKQPSWRPPAMDDDYADHGFRLQKVPPAVWRMLAVVLAAVVLLWLLFAGIRALYRATMNAPSDDVEATSAEQAPAAKPAASPAPAPAEVGKAAPAHVDRKPTKVPPLYID